MNLTENWFSSDFPEHCFSSWENFPKLNNVMCILSIEIHKTTLDNNFISKTIIITVPKGTIHQNFTKSRFIWFTTRNTGFVSNNNKSEVSNCRSPIVPLNGTLYPFCCLIAHWCETQSYDIHSGMSILWISNLLSLLALHLKDSITSIYDACICLY